MSERLNVPSLTFAGGSKTECLSFIRDIRREALALGKERDDRWVADLVGSCLEGDALDWHFDLAEEIQDSWKLLQVALREKYNSNSEENTTYGSVTPAAAYVVSSDS